jgi:formylglycine-generating enzyme required for sulfatase activity
MNQTQPDEESSQADSTEGAPKITHIEVGVTAGTVRDNGQVTGVKVDTIQGPVTIQVTGAPVDPEVLRRAAAVEALRKPVLSLKKFEPETVYISAGPFLMGPDPGDAIPETETPLPVPLPEYRIGRRPVSNKQYLAFVKGCHYPVAPATGWRLAREGREPPPGREDHPVVGVTWDDAVAYCQWLSQNEQTGRRYRLPSEAEWEKAGRGPATGPEAARTYPWGNSFDPNRCNSAESGGRDTSAVGSYSPQGDSPYGCADMAGNVWEWTSTRWGSELSQPEYVYPYDPADGREKLDQDKPLREYRIVRGGSYEDGADRVTCTTRDRDAANERHVGRGFRVAMDVSVSG